jgi:magnesium-transporting ATPase (P-type)
MLAVSGFLMLSTGYLLVRMGIIVDEYGVDTLGSFWIGIGLWITALLSSILLFITYLFFAVQNKQKPFVVAVYVVASLAIFAFCMTSIVHTFSYQNEITKDPPPKVTTPKIIKISLTELDSIKTDKKSCIVYDNLIIL